MRHAIWHLVTAQRRQCVAHGLLAPVRGGGKYQLSADLKKLDQPMIGLDMTVTATISWHLVERASGRNVFQREIGTPFTAKMSDAFIGSERMKLANEGAIRRSIKAFIEEILRTPVEMRQWFRAEGVRRFEVTGVVKAYSRGSLHEPLAPHAWRPTRFSQPHACDRTLAHFDVGASVCPPVHCDRLFL